MMTIRVTDEQRELIAAIWAHNDWDLDIVEEEGGSAAQPLLHQEITYNAGYPIAPDEAEDECPYCLCRPCVTSETFRQGWWEEEHPPHRNNHQKRRPIYYRFWVMLANRGAWADPRYLQKKATSMDNDNEDYVMVGIGMHRRDIMPECVLKLVRTWLPNMEGQPYMGHKWS